MSKGYVFFDDDDDYVEFRSHPCFEATWSPSPSNDQEKNRSNVLQPNHASNDEKVKKQLEENNSDGNIQTQPNRLSRDEKGKKIVEEEEENNVGCQKDAPCSPDSDQSTTEWVNGLICSGDEVKSPLPNPDLRGQENDNIRGQLSRFKDQDREQMLRDITTAITQTLQRARDALWKRHPLSTPRQQRTALVEDSESSQKKKKKKTRATPAGEESFNIVILDPCRTFGEKLDQERRDAAIRGRQNDQEKQVGNNVTQDQVPFRQRLEGWKLIRRQRAAGRVDTFFRHEATQCRFRSEREVIEFVLKNSTPTPSQARKRKTQTPAPMAQDRAQGRDNLFPLAWGYMNPTAVGSGKMSNYNYTSQLASSSLTSMPTLSRPQLMKEYSRMQPHNTMNMERESGSTNTIFNPRPLNQVPPAALRPPIYHEFSGDPRHDPTIFNPRTTEIQEYSFPPPPGPTIFNPWTAFHQEFPFTPSQGPFIVNPGAPVYQYQVSAATPPPGPSRMGAAAADVQVVGQSSNNGNGSRTGAAAANLQVVDQNNNNRNDHGRRVGGPQHGQGPNEDERNAVDIPATFRSGRQ